MASIARDHNRPALPNGCPLNISSTSPKGRPAHIGSSPGRIRRHASIIISPKGGKSGCVVRTGKVVIIENRTTDAIGIASIFNIDCSRSNRDSYSRPGPKGKRSTVTGFFTPPPARFCHRGLPPVEHRAPAFGSFLTRWHRVYLPDRPVVGQAPPRWFSSTLWRMGY